MITNSNAMSYLRVIPYSKCMDSYLSPINNIYLCMYIHYCALMTCHLHYENCYLKGRNTF